MTTWDWLIICWIYGVICFFVGVFWACRNNNCPNNGSETNIEEEG